MSQKFLDSQSEIFFSNSKSSDAVSRLIKAGKIKKIGPRLYTKNLESTPEDLVRAKIWDLVSSYFPGAIITDRSAIELKPATDGSVFIIPANNSTRPRNINLPGIIIKPRPGTGPLPDDRTYLNRLYLPSQPRIILENMKVTRAHSGGVARTLSQQEIEETLDKILQRSGEEQLLHIRDKARKIAPMLKMEKEAEQLNQLIGSLLGTKDGNLINQSSQARRAGIPYDQNRIELFHKLHQALLNYAPHTCEDVILTTTGWKNRAFFEAYFSNYIEGTEFQVQEAQEIIFGGKIPMDRPEDAHDIMGTYQIASERKNIEHLPTNKKQLLKLLRERHKIIMSARPDKNPGQFKQLANRAGSTHFVCPNLVVGTLQKAFEYYPSLTTPFHKAIFMKFLISEVHPFVDGNGRIARIMMNAELVAKGQGIIIIPTVYRNNYLASLKALSNNHNAEAYIRVMDFAQRWTKRIRWNDFDQALNDLTSSNALIDPTEGEESGQRLKMPV